MPHPHPLPVAVIGSGRMGRLHARHYAQMPAVKLVGVCDANPAAAASAAAEFGTQAFSNVDELLPLVQAVTIATPTSAHVASAEPFLKRGIACLIEKPLAGNEADCRRIVALARQNNAIVQVGHIERFNPAVRAVSDLKLSPRYIEAWRVSPMTFRSIDVGVVLDIMIHDIDIVLSLAGHPDVARVDANGVSVLGSVEDIASARVTFANGCVANLTASRLALKTERRLRVYARDAFVSVDYAKKQGVIIRRGEHLDRLRETAGKVRTGELRDVASLNYTDFVKMEPLTVTDQDQLRAQLEAFVASVTSGAPIVVSAEHAMASVRLANQIAELIKPGMEV